MSKAEADPQILEAVRRHIRYTLAAPQTGLDPQTVLHAAAMAVRDRLVDGMLETQSRYAGADAKRLYYLSMEFLMGRSLGNNLHNLGLYEECREALATLDLELTDVLECEPDAGLGNGGLGRLAACFLDSLATMDMPGFGYGINYEFGLFRQEINSGSQVEKPDHWRARPTPWLIERPHEACLVPIHGHIEHARDRHGDYNPMWLGWRLLVGVPADMPVVGYGGHTVNYLRLYSARSSDEFDMQIFNDGEYFRAVEQKIASETVSKVLYPSDSVAAGRELRLIQEYFLVACSVRDIIRGFERHHSDLSELPRKVAMQLNDTHPALAVAELMRLLIDERDLAWDTAWEITTATLSYTNHTLLPEALEKWPVELLERVLPRHLQIIHEINRRFLEHVWARHPGDVERQQRMSLIDRGETQQVRMAHLALVGSHAVNGVSALHTGLVISSLMPDFHELWPERFSNKTNGVTPRRWLVACNPALAALISGQIGPGWITDLEQLRALQQCAADAGFQDEFLKVKRANKVALAKIISSQLRLEIDPDALLDVHAKRIHEYKRQLLKAMHIIHQYLTLKDDGMTPLVPRTYVFAGKAAPGYWAAKQVIRLIHAVAATVNQDAAAAPWMRVAFLPDYRVSRAERIIPAADLSEQISTAGMEASGTGNMKFTINGALTIGTLDGANIEIRDEVGPDSIYTFGLTAEQVATMHSTGSYDPRRMYEEDSRIRRVVDALGEGRFNPQDPSLFQWVRAAFLDEGDTYFHLADFGAYLDAQVQVEQDFQQRQVWATKAITNVARAGLFSSDRTIREYAQEIWDLAPVAPL
jgi:glycogen phosphorylase